MAGHENYQNLHIAGLGKTIDKNYT